MQTKQMLMEQVTNLKQQVKKYQEDRFCQGGCAIYQYDKLNKYKQYFDKINEQATLLKAFLIANGKKNTDACMESTQSILDMCACALDGKLW